MTVVTLYQSLIDAYPGYGDDHAGAKLHVVESVSTGRWLAGALLLYDQGFFDYRTMDLIDANKGWFVTRLRPNANPRIVEELHNWRGNSISLTGKQLHTVPGDLHRDVIDVRVEVSQHHNRYV